MKASLPIPRMIRWLPIIYLVYLSLAAAVLTVGDVKLSFIGRIVVFYLPVLIGGAVLMKYYLRVLLAVSRTSGACCVHCLYPLVNLPDRGICPECGSAFDIEETRRHWKGPSRDARRQRKRNRDKGDLSGGGRQPSCGREDLPPDQPL